MSEPTTATPDQVFYRYEGPDGRVQLVDNLEKLPPEARAKAQRLDFPGSGKSALGGALEDLLSEEITMPRDGATSTASVPSMHWPSFVIGLGAGVGAVLILRLLFSPGSSSFGKRLLVSTALVIGLAAVLGGLYLGWLRKSTGQSDGALATPQQIIDDAKRTMKQVEQRRKEQEQQLDDLEHVK